MAEPDTLPEPDRLDDAPHPRETLRLYGQDEAEAQFLDAHNSGRLHHGWLLTGPRGVGKATLAWKLARFLLATPPDAGGLFGTPAPATLDIPDDHPVARRLRAGADGGLLHLRRGHDEKGRLRQVIRVDEMRRLHGFFGLSAADAGRRVVLVDAADEMTPNAANALLKALEEPPPDATLLLVAHRPARLLPTIRSRCRTLRLAPLAGDDFAAALAQAGVEADSAALAELSSGSVGAAFSLVRGGGAELYADLTALFAGLPRLDRPRALALADATAGRGNETRFHLTLTLIEQFLARLARAAILGPRPEAVPGEAALMARLAPNAAAARRFAALADRLGRRARQGHAVNLDPASLVLDMILQIEAEARALS